MLTDCTEREEGREKLQCERENIYHDQTRDQTRSLNTRSDQDLDPQPLIYYLKNIF